MTVVHMVSSLVFHQTVVRPGAKHRNRSVPARQEDCLMNERPIPGFLSGLMGLPTVSLSRSTNPTIAMPSLRRFLKMVVNPGQTSRSLSPIMRRIFSSLMTKNRSLPIPSKPGLPTLSGIDSKRQTATPERVGARLLTQAPRTFPKRLTVVQRGAHLRSLLILVRINRRLLIRSSSISRQERFMTFLT